MTAFDSIRYFLRNFCLTCIPLLPDSLSDSGSVDEKV